MMRWIKWHFELGLTRKFSCITFWLRKINHRLGFFFINCVRWWGTTETFVTLGACRNIVTEVECNCSCKTGPHTMGQIFFQKHWNQSTLLLLNSTGSMLFPHVHWPCFSHSYSFPAVLLPHKEQPVWRMAALWFMGLLSLPSCLHSLHSNKTARRVWSSHVKWKRYSVGGKEGIKRDPSRFRCCKHICRVTIKQWLQRSAFQNVS